MNKYPELKDVFLEYQGYPDFTGCSLQGPNDQGNFGDRPLNFAAGRGDLDQVQLLLKCGADVNLPGEEGYTPLHSAVRGGNMEVIRALIAAGADLDARNRDNLTAREVAEILEKPAELIQLLESAEPPRDSGL